MNFRSHYWPLDSNRPRISTRSITCRSLIASGLLLTSSVACPVAARQPAEPVLGGPPLTAPVATSCRSNQLYFDGSCRYASWFESRFVTEGATFVLMEGSRSANAANGVVITEMPNPRTVTIRTLSARRSTPLTIGRRYLDGYEILGESTSTSWIDAEGFQHLLSSVDKPNPYLYETAQWEHVVRGLGRSWRWSSELCFDFYGNPSEGCGPMTAIASSSGSSSDGCEAIGDATGAAAGLACLGIVAGTTLIATGVAIIVTTETIGVAAPVGAAGVTATATIGVASCAAAANLISSTAETHCREEHASYANGNAPPSIGIVLETSQLTPFGEDPCNAVGGETYSGPPVIVGNDCGGVEGGSSGASQITLAEDDGAAYEVVVYGDPIGCSPGTMVTANDGMCIVIN